MNEVGNEEVVKPEMSGENKAAQALEKVFSSGLDDEGGGNEMETI